MTRSQQATAVMTTAALVWVARVLWEAIPTPTRAAPAFACEARCACRCNRTGCGCHGR